MTPKVGEFVSFSKPKWSDEWHEVLGIRDGNVIIPVYSTDDRQRWVEAIPLTRVQSIRHGTGAGGVEIKQSLGPPCTYVHGKNFYAAYSWSTDWPTPIKATAKYTFSRREVFPRA